VGASIDDIEVSITDNLRRSRMLQDGFTVTTTILASSDAVAFTIQSTIVAKINDGTLATTLNVPAATFTPPTIAAIVIEEVHASPTPADTPAPTPADTPASTPAGTVVPTVEFVTTLPGSSSEFDEAGWKADVALLVGVSIDDIQVSITDNLRRSRMLQAGFTVTTTILASSDVLAIQNTIAAKINDGTLATTLNVPAATFTTPTIASIVIEEVHASPTPEPQGNAPSRRNRHLAASSEVEPRHESAKIKCDKSVPTSEVECHYCCSVLFTASDALDVLDTVAPSIGGTTDQAHCDQWCAAEQW